MVLALTFFLENQDLLNMRDANNETPLMVAKSHDHITLVEYLDLIQNDPRVAKKVYSFSFGKIDF